VFEFESVEVARRAGPRTGVIGEYGGRTGDEDREPPVECGDCCCDGRVLRGEGESVSTVSPGIELMKVC
jgi:hypothetical protein